MKSKKIVFFTVSLLMLFSLYVRGEEGDKELSRWSLSVDVGINGFDGDIRASTYGFFKNVRGGLSLGGQIDYTFNPIVSLGLSYHYFPVAANNDVHAFTSNKHQVAPILSFNLLPVFSSTTLTKWGLWFSAGVGLAYFESELYKNQGTQNEVQKGQYVSNLNAYSIVIPLGINLEYNFTKNFALGLKMNYISDNRDDLEGGVKVYQDLNLRGVTNDFLLAGFINARWKFGAQKKSHTRNINWKTFRDLVPDEALSAAKKNQKDIDETKEKLKVQDDAIAALEKRMQGVESRLSDIEKLLSSEGEDSDGDGIPDHRDKEPNTKPGTPVDFWGKSVTLKEYLATPAIFFDHDKSILDNQAKETIFIISEMLKTNPELLVEVRGFTDFTGTDEYNQKLSVRRAERVKKELVEIYGIDAARIGINGKGRLTNPNVSYRPNRRVEFHFNE